MRQASKTDEHARDAEKAERNDDPTRLRSQSTGGSGSGDYQKYYQNYMDKYGSSGAGGYEQFMSKYAGGYASKYMPGDKKAEASGPVSFAADASSDKKKKHSEEKHAADHSSEDASQSQGSQGGDYKQYMDYSKYTQGAQGGSQAGRCCVKCVLSATVAALGLDTQKTDRLMRGGDLWYSSVR